MVSARAAEEVHKKNKKKHLDSMVSARAEKETHKVDASFRRSKMQRSPTIFVLYAHVSKET
jgi:hypothetical protein